MGIREKLYAVMGLLLAFIVMLWGVNFYIVSTLEDTAPLLNRASGLRWRAYALSELHYEYKPGITARTQSPYPENRRWYVTIPKHSCRA